LAFTLLSADLDLIPDQCRVWTFGNFLALAPTANFTVSWINTPEAYLSRIGRHFFKYGRQKRELYVISFSP
jgi:hypothetical protein